MRHTFLALLPGAVAGLSLFSPFASTFAMTLLPKLLSLMQSLVPYQDEDAHRQLAHVDAQVTASLGVRLRVGVDLTLTPRPTVLIVYCLLHWE